MEQEGQTQKELEKRIIELNILDSRFREIQQQLALLEQQLNELQLLKNNVGNLNKIKQDSETLSQLGQGIFVKSKIMDTKEVFVDIGSRVVIKKSLIEAQEIIERRIEQFMNIKNMIARELNEIILNIQLIEREIQSKTLKK